MQEVFDYVDEQIAKAGGILGDLPIASDVKAGVVMIRGGNLSIDNRGIVSVDVANQVEEDNTRPITSAAVYAEVGNINALLETI